MCVSRLTLDAIRDIESDPKVIDAFAKLSEYTLKYILEALGRDYIAKKNEYSDFTDHEKDLFWKDLKDREKRGVEKGELEQNMLTLGQITKEEYWEKMSAIAKFTKQCEASCS